MSTSGSGARRQVQSDLKELSRLKVGRMVLHNRETLYGQFHKAAEGLEVLMVDGLDQLFEDRKYIYRLNMLRESIYELGIPVVFFCSPTTGQKISRYAPDLMDQSDFRVLEF